MAGVVVAVMCEWSLAHWCLRLVCWVWVVRGTACFLGPAVEVVPVGWLCVSGRGHIRVGWVGEGVMCEPGLAHSGRWWCCVAGVWLVFWVVFLARGVGGRYV